MSKVKLVIVAIIVSIIAATNLSPTANALDVVFKAVDNSSYTSRTQTPIITLAQIEITKGSSFTSFVNNIIGTVVAIVSISYATSIYVQSRRHPNRDKNRN